MSLALILSILATIISCFIDLPQLIKIYKTKSTRDISLWRYILVLSVLVLLSTSLFLTKAKFFIILPQLVLIVTISWSIVLIFKYK